MPNITTHHAITYTNRKFKITAIENYNAPHAHRPKEQRVAINP